MTQVRGVVGLVVIVCRRCRRLRRSGCRVLERLELGLKIENVLTKAQWVKVQSFDAVILEIESGRAQIAVLDSIQAKQYIARRRRGQFILPTPKFESDQNLAVRSGAEDLKEWLNVTLRFMEQRGELGAIWDKYLNMA